MWTGVCNVGRHTSIRWQGEYFPNPTTTMALRGPRLKKIFEDVINGDRQLTDSLVSHFIKSISTHPDPAACLHALVTSRRGLEAVRASISSNPSIEFLNGDLEVLLAYLRDSQLEYLGGGDILQRLLRALVDAPGFWDSFVVAFNTAQLQRQTEHSFSWLLLQLVVSPLEIATKYRSIASGTEIVHTLYHSSDPQTRSNARKINHIVSLYPGEEEVPSNWFEAPGWRHNNDHHSYRDISILPTPEEINSTERPSLRTVDEIDDLNLTCPIKMFEVHVENQFRLLRDDLVRDTRENVQVALGKKAGKPSGVHITDLFLTDVYTADDERSKWGLEFDCAHDLPFFASATGEAARRDRLERDRNFLRHGSFACLFSEIGVIAFVTVVRDVDLLVQDPPVIVVQLGGGTTTKDALSQLRRHHSVSLAQISTPLFAYEPVLRSLQAMRFVRFLRSGALLVKPHRPRAADGELSDIDRVSLLSLIHGLDRTPGAIGGIMLDVAQTEALIWGLTQKVALIQGPPGICLFTPSVPPHRS